MSRSVPETTSETKPESDEQFLRRMQDKFRLSDHELQNLLLRYRTPDGGIRRDALWGHLSARSAPRR